METSWLWVRELYGRNYRIELGQFLFNAKQYQIYLDGVKVGHIVNMNPSMGLIIEGEPDWTPVCMTTPLLDGGDIQVMLDLINGLGYE